MELWLKMLYRDEIGQARSPRLQGFASAAGAADHHCADHDCADHDCADDHVDHHHSDLSFMFLFDFFLHMGVLSHSSI